MTNDEISFPGNDELCYFLSYQGQISMSMYLVDHEIRLKLKPTSLNQEWQNYQQAVKKFHEWFKKEKEKLEDKYDIASAGAKINAAKKLIVFILEAEIKWQKICRPTSGTWEGKRKETFKAKFYGNIDFVMVVTADIKIEIMKPRYPGGPSVIEGIIDNSKLTMNVDSPIPAVKNLMDGTVSYSGVIIGLAEEDFINLTSGMVYEKANVAFGDGKIINLSAVWTGENLRAFFNSYAIVLRMNLRSPFISLPKMPNVHFAIFDKVFLHGVEDFDPMPYYIKYFKFYVNAIDNYRSIQFDQKPVGEKHLLAEDTIKELLSAAALGQTLGEGIPDQVYIELRLIFNNPYSLYDKWFRLWFSVGYEEKHINVQNNPGNVQYLEDRFNFVLRACDKRDLGTFSDQLFIDFGLIIPGGKLLEETYEPYYIRSVEVWKEKITNNAANVTAALDWIISQSIYRAEMIFSMDFCMKIGLRPIPPKAQVEFERLGGLR